MEHTRMQWRTMIAVAALGLLGASTTEAATCSQFAAKRVAHFEQVAERAVAQCVRRDAGACPDARTTKRLDAATARIARSVTRRCPDVAIVDQLAAVRTGVLCELTGACGQPRTITVSVGAGDVSPGARTPSDRTLTANAGWTGLAHGLTILEGASFTAELADCDGEGDPLCTLHGETAGTHFGAPSPLGGGGVTFCVDVAFVSDIDGAYDLASGALTYDAAIRIEVYNGYSIDQPCPACVPIDGDPQLGEAGTCVSGPSAGAACVVDGLGDAAFGTFRATSRACGPGASRLAVFETRASATTDALEIAPLPDGPRCHFGVVPGEICPCGSCDEAPSKACRSSADCPRADGTLGDCGRRRGIPIGLAKRNACLSEEESTAPATCTPTGDGDGGGVCLAGPLDQVCAIARHRGCLSDDDCPLGDHCTMEFRRCHPDVVTLEGTPAPPVDGASDPTLVGGFCMAAAGNAAVNAAAGFPGLVTYIWPTEVTLGQ